MKYKMYEEAKRRMNILKVGLEDWEAVLNKDMKKICVDHENCKVRLEELTDVEKEMILKIEKRYGFLVYYCIKDTGIWPDGCSFERYTFPYVDEHEEEYEGVVEECIGRCRTLPAYVVNMEEPDCSEVTEFAFEVINNIMINVS